MVIEFFFNNIDIIFKPRIERKRKEKSSLATFFAKPEKYVHLVEGVE